MGEKKDHKSEIIMHYNATKCEVDVLDKHLYEINEVLAIETSQIEWCCVCKCICTVDGEIS